MKEVKNTAKSTGDVYRHIFKNKKSSRQMICQDLGISLPTVAQTLNALRDAELIFNAGEFESTGGRKATMFSIVANARVAIGVDISKTRLVLVLVDMNLDILDYVKMRIFYEDTEEYYKNISVQIENILEKNEIDREKLLGIGVSLPAIIEEETNLITYAEVMKIPVDFYQKICKEIPYEIMLFNDASSAGWVERWNKEDDVPIAYLALNDSVGGAFATGKLYKGMNWRAAEFGHMTIVPQGKQCYCGCKGCLDAYCSAKVLSDFTNGDLKEFFHQLKDNKGYQAVFEDYMNYLAIAVNNLRMCYDCDVVLGGRVGACMEEHLEEFKKKAVLRTPFENHADYIKICHFRTESSAVGAALYYIDRFVKKF